MVAFIHISLLPIPSRSRTVTRFYSSTPALKSSISNLSSPLLNADIVISGGGTTGGSSSSGGGGGGGGNHGKDGSSPDDHHNDDPSGHVDPVNLFLQGWRSRVSADPQFLFKLLMEQLVGVSACVLGDMACRPNFGFNELDFVFSTLVVGSILNFVLMYMLAPTAGSASFAASSLPSYFFEPGNYSILSRIGALAYKGAYFAAVGFVAGLAGTAISNGLIALRRKMDPEFELQNKPPPTLLNAGTWAIQMGVSSNLRYQTLNGVEFLMARVLPSAGFKVFVLALRCLNNVVGGMSFVVLARMTGSQKVEEKGKGQAGGYGELQRTESSK
ncbi:protein RETICULATA-RELATED 3, chloroplastic [Dendrobium catenatum]|uniref:Protein RETICULATA-RELATED 3, chloroplastic n=1 Tax=Dendrobium catenatum TaxID=906689 RepID=A0A2I0X2Z2_9ASPA|nr:protein RETICULATA-RELATED 3, chloroplastic [Dendrobium catenatum]PKU82279.1 hypothetical protein MA16_Dca017501 [Dendrobium catenatum]